jgi:hypothetical protein
VEGGGSVLGYRKDHRKRLARRLCDERDAKDDEEGEESCHLSFLLPRCQGLIN